MAVVPSGTVHKCRWRLWLMVQHSNRTNFPISAVPIHMPDTGPVSAWFPDGTTGRGRASQHRSVALDNLRGPWAHFHQGLKVQVAVQAEYRVGDFIEKSRTDRDAVRCHRIRRYGSCSGPRMQFPRLPVDALRVKKAGSCESAG